MRLREEGEIEDGADLGTQFSRRGVSTATTAFENRLQLSLHAELLAPDICPTDVHKANS